MRHAESLILIACVLVGVSASATRAHAQFPAEVQAGTRVRVWIPEPHRQADGPPRRQLLRGTVQGVASDRIALSVPGTTGAVSIPRASVRRIEISRGTSRAASAVERAAGGAVAGAIFWALMNDPRRTGGPSYRTDWQAAGVGAAWGGGVGAVVGLLFPHERWHRVRLPRE